MSIVPEFFTITKQLSNFLLLNYRLIIGYLLALRPDCYSGVVNYNRRTYPNMLKVIRQNAGYTQQYVATLLGHSNVVTLSKWEKEKAMPNGINLIKLCIVYGCTPKELYPHYYEIVDQGFSQS